MNSIGNDIIALNLINKERTCRKRFYSQILNPAEKALYNDLSAASLPFEHYVWLLWSIKESAYKFLKRLDHHLVFSPTKIFIEYLETIQPSFNGNYYGQTYIGKVTIRQHDLYFHSTINQEYIHSVVISHQDQSFIEQQMHYIQRSDYETQSAAVKKFALSSSACLLPYTHLQINKHLVGYPQITSAGELLPFPLSLAHHGHYVAFAFDTSAIKFTSVS